MSGKIREGFIKEGYGFTVGHDFTRADRDIPIQIDVHTGRQVYGYIAGNPDSRLGFMRAARIRVCVGAAGVRED